MKRVKLSWLDIESLIENIVEELNLLSIGWKPSHVVGVARGGLVPAVILSHKYNVPFSTVNVSYRDTLVDTNINVTVTSNTLVVEDIIDTGKTLSSLKDIYPTDFKSASLLSKVTSQTQPHFVGRTLDEEQSKSWIVFPWESS